MSNQNMLKEGDHFIFEVNNESYQFCVAEKGQQVKLGKKQYFPVECVIGCEWGSIFEVDQDTENLVQVEQPSCYIDPWTINFTQKSNADIVQQDSNQQISTQEIYKMKEDKVGGAQIVDALIAGSKTFEAKNEFSQQKYKHKKAKKYASWGVLRKPTAWIIAQAYYKKNPARVYNLRQDTLSMLLCAGNVRAGSRLLVVDACVGIVTGAALERMGGQGTLCQVQFNDRAQNALIPGDAVSKYNLTNEELSVLRLVTYNMLSKGRQQTMFEDETEYIGYTEVGMTYTEPPAPLEHAMFDDEAEYIGYTEDGMTYAEPTEIISECNLQLADIEDNGAKQRQQANGDEQTSKQQEDKNQIKQWSKRWPEATAEEIQDMVGVGFDGVIIVAPAVDPYHLVELLSPFTMPSASLAIYSNYLEPLTKCYGQMQESKLYINLFIQEAWLREYQVLPARTRPPMTMEGTGGYFMMATKVQDAPVSIPIKESSNLKKQKIHK
eukprot:TRINITY_DN452_c1_g1_i4.p1 TRINITY_DN452_c1_g1~~TRINITY_DN452_c1_g1_i4.p1  ORF type:complete len:517 (+),score=84.01 TRINITY_DN452_c1_g1_i4:75-1553(+)